MRRRYKRELYADRVAHIKQTMPHACIGVDVIVGFPGETDEDFQETFDFIHGLDVSYLHVFTYSERNNTPAAEMEEVVPMDVRRERNQRLRQLSKKKQHAFYTAHIGEARPVLLEKSKTEGQLQGFTDNYVKVVVPEKGNVRNSIIEAMIEEYDPEAGAMCGLSPMA